MPAIGYQYEAGTGELSSNEMRVSFPAGTRNVGRLLHALRQSAVVDEAHLTKPVGGPPSTPVLFIWLMDPERTHIAYDQARDGVLSIVDKFARGEPSMQPPAIDALMLRRMDEARVALDELGYFRFPVLCAQDRCQTIVDVEQTLDLETALADAGTRRLDSRCAAHTPKPPKKKRRGKS